MSQKWAKAAKEAKDGFKTNWDTLRRTTQTLLEIDALEGQRAETVEAFLTKLRKEMRKAKMPQSAIEAVK